MDERMDEDTMADVSQTVPEAREERRVDEWNGMGWDGVKSDEMGRGR